ncbi:major facilitator superfamily domain-containing protein [Dactylonectria macrodidyma]|uniref:Major facilitator superfamily domain-containing protein n=1 Tax=Dactylonectria macrodidyma TaxID=307937 RepID=A0A9P9EP32_9HYPO|nr:major facilitator superfamily domain-containing protein [Dactylonectria macrodidyma]
MVNLLNPAAEIQSGCSTELSITLRLDALDPAFSLPDLLKYKGIDNSTILNLPPNHNHLYQAPYQWTTRRKITTLCGTFIASTLAAYSAGAYAMASQQLKQKWSVSDTEYNLGITLFVAGFGFAPMIMAPISENHGRYWVFVGAGVVFFLGTMGCAVTGSFAGMLVSRLVTGSGASIFATLTGGVVGDLFHEEQRNTPMALYSATIMVGTGLGPMFSGLIVENLSWQWVFYPQMITVGLATLCLFFFFSETRNNVILKHKCTALNKLWDQTPVSVKSSLDATSSSTPIKIHFCPQLGDKPKLGISIIWTSFAFPLKLLFTEPVVFLFSAWVSFAWAILYMQFTSIGLVFRDVYNFNNSEVGAVYTAVVVGSVLSAALSILQDRILRKLWPDRMFKPEGWLYAACIESVLLPIGLFWFGWSATPRVSYVVPALAIGSCTIGIFNIYLAVFNYLAETYHRYASSALAAQSMCRNLLAGLFPLFTHIMFRNLSNGIAGSVLGCVGILLTAVPWLLSLFGEKIRARSPFASQLKGEGSSL